MPIVGSQVIQALSLRHARDGRFAVDRVGVHLVGLAATSSARGSGSAGSSMTETAGDFEPRRVRPVGAGCRAIIRPHVVTEMR